MARSTRLESLIKNIYIYFMGSETLPSACYILSDEATRGHGSITFCKELLIPDAAFSDFTFI